MRVSSNELKVGQRQGFVEISPLRDKLHGRNDFAQRNFAEAALLQNRYRFQAVKGAIQELVILGQEY